MKNFVGLYMLAFLVISVVSAGFCATGKSLRTVDLKDRNITGEFTLFLYGNRFLDDPETTAIMDIEGDQYAFEIYAPDFDYKVEKHVPAKEALEKAEKFISRHSSFLHSRLTKIIDNEGSVIGYELRPLYLPIAYGVEDALDVDYRIKDSRVIVKIRLVPSVENILSNGGGKRIFRIR